mmetsp:Transcript_48819/g.114705  ORF Transcript_48819/g.114705 Transcript_48819/m.114705 type:complete len:206 (+) Transcript_48819:585-1202(+)
MANTSTSAPHSGSRLLQARTAFSTDPWRMASCCPTSFISSSRVVLSRFLRRSYSSNASRNSLRMASVRASASCRCRLCSSSSALKPLQVTAVSRWMSAVCSRSFWFSARTSSMKLAICFAATSSPIWTLSLLAVTAAENAFLTEAASKRDCPNQSASSCCMFSSFLRVSRSLSRPRTTSFSCSKRSWKLQSSPETLAMAHSLLQT